MAALRRASSASARPVCIQVKCLWQSRSLLWVSRRLADTRLHRRYYADSCFAVSASQHTLTSLQARCRRLKRLLDRLHWPVVSHFCSSGKHYELPVSASVEGMHSTALPQEKIDYLAGFFDGDGCVSALMRLSSCQLTVTQAIDAAEVLLLFQSAFGGSIVRGRRGRGLRRPTLAWFIAGTEGKHAARCLERAAVVKRPQLSIAAAWPVESDKRATAAAMLKCLKQHNQKSSSSISWHYLAGFFDAEGCIRVPSHSSSIQLKLSQKHSAVLLNILQFLNSSIPKHTARLYPHGGGQLLSINHSRFSSIVLRQLLASGLLVKRSQALLVLGLDCNNHTAVRRRLMESKGNQSRYRFLDGRGCKRAVDIDSLAKSLRWFAAKGSEDVVEVKSKMLEHLKQEHALHNARTEYCALRQDIRMLLRRGGSLAL
eukprot:TRINITY_DN106359_c0_g1_i1.p1 TRINITY_DN106359_c0_g1~~TRINITY_DN106359_c0_g1_i1.p1  ORF type:complete len:428 (-),score=49.20 TRINITY_DN106359_c0_g1_i1:124-1407(-)